MAARIEAAREVTPALLAAVQALLPTLTTDAPAVDEAALARILATPGLTLLVARTDDDQILGMATLLCFEIPSGRRARLEDVVVSPAGQGQGIGAALTHEAIRLARAYGPVYLDLTSSPWREAANRLYERLGFERRETKVYRYVLDQRPPE